MYKYNIIQYKYLEARTTVRAAFVFKPSDQYIYILTSLEVPSVSSSPVSLNISLNNSIVYINSCFFVKLYQRQQDTLKLQI